jgi:DNA-binding winged helix-turn-helix (wHTH) protein
MEQNVKYVFGSFHLHTDTQLLWHEGQQISLPPKVYQVLLYLLQHPGRLIFREELFEAVWQGRVVEDTSLRLAINGLRKALHDESKTPQYILTVCKRGYRFLPDVAVEMVLKSTLEPLQNLDLQYRPKLDNQQTELIFTAELAVLQDAYQQAATGNRRLLLLNGARGCGKTTLLEQFLSTVQHPELMALRVFCLQLAAEEPFLSLLESLALHCRTPTGNGLVDCLHRVAPTWLYQMLNLLHPEQIATLFPKVMYNNSGRMLREGADFIETLAAQATFILILDDAQWSDTFTLDLVNLLISRNSTVKLLVLVSYRSGKDNLNAQKLKAMADELCYRGLAQEISLRKTAKWVGLSHKMIESKADEPFKNLGIKERRFANFGRREAEADRRFLSLGRRHVDGVTFDN